MNKKGALEGLQNLVAPLIVIGMILVVGFLIMSEVRDQVIDSTSVGTEVINESIAYTANTFTELVNASNCMALSCSTLINASAGDVISTSEYACEVGRGINITNTSGNVDTAALVTYTCFNKSIAFNATQDVQNATSDIPGWLPIIVITIIGALLLGLVKMFRSS